MNKQEFLKALSERLDKLPENEKNKSINYYLEMIDDRIEEGASEDEAIDALGGIEDIAENIMSQYPDVNKKQSIKKRFNLNTVTIILLIIGSPIWLSILLCRIRNSCRACFHSYFVYSWRDLRCCGIARNNVSKLIGGHICLRLRSYTCRTWNFSCIRFDTFYQAHY